MICDVFFLFQLHPKSPEPPLNPIISNSAPATQCGDSQFFQRSLDEPSRTLGAMQSERPMDSYTPCKLRLEKSTESWWCLPGNYGDFPSQRHVWLILEYLRFTNKKFSPPNSCLLKPFQHPLHFQPSSHNKEIDGHKKKHQNQPSTPTPSIHCWELDIFLVPSYSKITILPESLATTLHTMNGRNINECVFFRCCLVKLNTRWITHLSKKKVK